MADVSLQAHKNLITRLYNEELSEGEIVKRLKSIGVDATYLYLPSNVSIANRPLLALLTYTITLRSGISFQVLRRYSA
jgi:hypothetical protein